jgi:hypothetical protein
MQVLFLIRPADVFCCLFGPHIQKAAHRCIESVAKEQRRTNAMLSYIKKQLDIDEVFETLLP